MSSLKRGGDKNPWNAVDDAPAPSGANTYGRGDHGMDDSMVNMGTVNMGTMPANQGFGQTVMSDATRARMQATRNDPGNQTAYEQMENRPIRPAGARARPSNGMGGDDSVLMGTVAGGGRTMVNMGTMNMGGGQTMAGSTVNYGTVNMGGGRTNSSNPWALGDASPTREF